MKQFFTFLGIVAMSATAYGQADTDIVNIPDVYFKRYLVENTFINSNNDSEISYGEARALTGSIDVSRKRISNLAGIEAFENITGLNCSYNRLVDLDLSKNTKLSYVSCEHNELTSLNVNDELEYLFCNNNQLTGLDISNSTKLNSLFSDNNQIISIDVSKNAELKYLTCNNNKLTSLDVSKNTKLNGLGCSNNSLTHLDVSNNTKLRSLSCSRNQLTSLVISNNVELQSLSCNDNQLTSLDISTNIELTRLECNNNQISKLDVSNNIELTHLECQRNKITDLEISKNIRLEYLSCDYNELMSLDISNNKKLSYLYCRNNQLTQLNLANGNNNKLLEMWALYNPNLTCIQIDTGVTPRSSWTKDDHASYSNNCNYTLSTTEIKAENAIQILNPVKDNLIIKTTAKIESIEIYNTAGQLVKVLFRGNTQVQDLAKGVYLIKITTDKGVITEKIVK